MKRYRVNYKLLVSLVVAVFAAIPGFYFLWRFQVARNSDRLKTRAEEALAVNDLELALDNMARYVALNPKDLEAQRDASEMATKVIDNRDATREAIVTAYDVLQKGATSTGDPVIRRRLVDILPKYGMFNRAIGEIDDLLADDVKQDDDQELYAIKVQCLAATKDFAKLKEVAGDAIGYDEAAGTFSAESATAPNKPMIYYMLAQILKLQDQKPEAALQVIDQMIAANPKSAEAFIYQHQYLTNLASEAKRDAALDVANAKARGDDDKKAEEAGAKNRELAAERAKQSVSALAQAYELEPDKDTVLFAKGQQAIADYSDAIAAGKTKEEALPRLEEAAKYFETGAKKYEDQPQFLERAAIVEAQRGEFDKAIGILDKGLAMFRLPSPNSLPLFNFKTELLLQKNDLAGVQDAIDKLRQYNDTDVKALAEFNEGRLQLVNKQWAKAALTLRLAKAKLLHFPEIQANASFFQGVAHEQLGQYDLARDAYEWSLTKNSGLARATEALLSLNARWRPSEGEGDDAGANSLEARIEKELEKPLADQKWDAIDEQIEELAKSRGLADAASLAMKAQVRLRRAEVAPVGKAKDALFLQARDLITQAYKKDSANIRVRILAIRLLLLQPGKGPAEALKLLDRMLADPKVEDTPELRSLRAELLVAKGDDDVREQLATVLTGIDKWTAEKQAAVYSSVGARFAQVGAFEEAQGALGKSLELAPNNLPTVRLLFDIALQKRDVPAVQRALDQIKTILGSDEDPDYMLAEIRRRMIYYTWGQATRDDLVEAQTMLDEALKRRPRWSELWVAKGQLELAVDDDAAAALKAFDMALETGPANANAIKVQISLLADRGAFAEAARKMKLLSESSIVPILGRTAAEVYRGTGDFAKAFTVAKQISQTTSNDPETLLWFANFAVAAEKYDDAEAALRKAASLNPADPQVWSKLIALFAQRKEFDKLEGILREAHLALDEDALPLLNAKYYEMQGRWHSAEDIYKAAFKDRQDEPEVLQRMAEFYLLWPVEQRGDPRRAAPYINAMLRMANDGKLDPASPAAKWARRRAASLAAAQGSYESALLAEKFLVPLVDIPKPEAADLRELALVLSNRSDPDSRGRAIELWEKLYQAGQLSTGEILLLGRLMSDTGRISEAQKLQEDAIVERPDDIALIRGYAQLLIDQREFVRARRQIASLDRKNAPPGVIAELNLRLAAKSGDTAKVNEVLTQMTPDLRAIRAADLERVRGIALLANDVGAHEYGLKMEREYVRRKPEGQLELARMEGLYGDVKTALELLNANFDDHIDDVARITMEMFRARRPQMGDVMDADVARIVRRALADDPENAQRLVLAAEELEITEKFDEAAAAYKAIAEGVDAPPLVKATALNNLAFLLALKGEKSRLDEALTAVNEAAKILGPISDILDTRAVVLMAQDKFEEAATDMKKSIQIGPTPSKYYHLARALLLSGDESGAAEAWKKGVAEGLAPDKISNLEHDQFNEFKAKVEAL